MFDDITFSLSSNHDSAVSPESQKFDLYLKAREVKQLAEVLQGLSSKSKAERLNWLRQNENLVANLVDTFTDESLSTLEGASMDREMMTMSMELMANLRRALLMLDGLFYDKRLTS